MVLRVLYVPHVLRRLLSGVLSAGSDKQVAAQTVLTELVAGIAV
jgi:hypothetical protein